jgi:hypothetical protein
VVLASDLTVIGPNDFARSRMMRIIHAHGTNVAIRLLTALVGMKFKGTALLETDQHLPIISLGTKVAITTRLELMGSIPRSRPAQILSSVGLEFDFFFISSDTIVDKPLLVIVLVARFDNEVVIRTT